MGDVDFKDVPDGQWRFVIETQRMLAAALQRTNAQLHNAHRLQHDMLRALHDIRDEVSLLRAEVARWREAGEPAPLPPVPEDSERERRPTQVTPFVVTTEKRF